MRRQRLFLRASLGLVIAAGACSRADAGSLFESGDPAPSASVGDLRSTSQLRCLPLSGASFSAAIGEDGGIFQVGPHTLEIPRGALTRTVNITGEIISDRVNSVRFQPEGLRLLRAAHLTLTYHNCPVAATLPVKRVALAAESLSLLQLMPSIDRPGQMTVTGSLEHLSRYAIAY